MGDLLYQVQFLYPGRDWRAFGEACKTRLEANQMYLDIISQHYGVGDDLTAIRIVSIAKHWDAVWRVKEVLAYKDFSGD